MYTIDLFEKWTDNFKRSIDCTNPKGFSQKAHCKGKSKTNEGQDNLDLMQGFRELLPVACKHLQIKKLPKIHLTKQQNEGKQPSFGGYDPNNQEISIGISNRHPVDVLRTLAHELVHYKQDCDNKLEANSHETGSPAENEANSEAGIIMRLFNKKCPQFMSVKPIQNENFADGKKPGRKGMSKRVGIPKGASISQLEKIAKSSSGEKRKMAQWQLNMKRGKKKANE